MYIYIYIWLYMIYGISPLIYVWDFIWLIGFYKPRIRFSCWPEEVALLNHGHGPGCHGTPSQHHFQKAWIPTSPKWVLIKFLSSPLWATDMVCYKTYSGWVWKGTQCTIFGMMIPSPYSSCNGWTWKVGRRVTHLPPRAFQSLCNIWKVQKKGAKQYGH